MAIVTRHKEVKVQAGQPVAGEKVLRSLDETEPVQTRSMKRTIYIVYIVLVLLGVGTGYTLSKQGAPSVGTKNVEEAGGGAVGVSDEIFKDTAEGVIEKGGLDGEGTHALIRDGGPSQTAYLISSVVDLDQFVGKKVTIWGQTIAADKAPWLMDVGKIELK